MDEYEKTVLALTIFKHMSFVVVLSSFSYWTTQIFKVGSMTREYSFLALLSLIILEYYNYKIHKKIFEIQDNIRLKKKKIADERELISSFLMRDFNRMNSSELSNLIDSFKYKLFLKESLKGYQKDLIARQDEARHVLEKIRCNEDLRALASKRKIIEEEIKEAKAKKDLEIMDVKEKNNQIKEYLDIDNNKVFFVENLGDEEITVLKNAGYKQVNEYDIMRSEIITVLVKPILNHSSTHTFLVWSIIRYLEELPEISNIEEHETRDADITFKHENKTYALEIETGNLLKKQKQLNEKIDYLNNKYKKRWMFVVSNKDLVAQYRKYGLSTHRKGVEENLQKLIRNQHPPKTGGEDE